MENRTALVRDCIAGSLSAMCIDWMDAQKSSDFKASASLKLKTAISLCQLAPRQLGPKGCLSFRTAKTEPSLHPAAKSAST